jgi:hypothetical protein
MNLVTIQELFYTLIHQGFLDHNENYIDTYHDIRKQEFCLESSHLDKLICISVRPLENYLRLSIPVKQLQDFRKLNLFLTHNNIIYKILFSEPKITIKHSSEFCILNVEVL